MKNILKIMFYSIFLKNIPGNFHKNLFMKKSNGPTCFNFKTKNQESYYNLLKNQNIKILFAVGPAGTGKTYLACNEAIHLLKNGLINKIIITRPVVPVEEDIGFLPGTLIKKMDPWTRPIFDIFEENFSKQEIDHFIKNNVIEISPLTYMRGRTFKNAIIIADEMQNSSPNQMLMLTTRIGENSKMIITGDLKQSDKMTNNGLFDFLNKFKKYINHFIIINNLTNDNYIPIFNKEVGIQLIELDNSDIQRSNSVIKILDIYEKYDSFIPNYFNRDDLNEKPITTKILHDAALIPKHLFKEIAS